MSGPPLYLTVPDYNRESMEPARIAELLGPFLGEPPANDQRPATDGALYQHISTYIDILLRWNARINLTAIRDPEEIVTRHFGESLFAARHLYPRSSPAPPVPSVVNFVPRVADLGSGAGFPGIPIKLWAPQISLTLIESSHKKFAFLREITRALTLTDINIITARAEAVAPTSLFDVVTLRAVENFRDILLAAATLLAPAGRLALLIGTRQLEQAHSTLPAFTWQLPQSLPQSRSRILVIGRQPTGISRQKLR